MLDDARSSGPVAATFSSLVRDTTAVAFSAQSNACTTGCRKLLVRPRRNCGCQFRHDDSDNMDVVVMVIIVVAVWRR